MQLALSLEDAAFRDEVRVFIAENYPAEMRVPNPESDELNVGHYFKRIDAINVQFGDPTYHLMRYAQQDESNVAPDAVRTTASNQR
jgi:hypothetical protein